MDTSGKDGTIRRVFTGLNPSGVHVVSFKAPTTTELEHDYLWRIHAELPRRGTIGAFNRSHYEDIVTVEVLGLITAAQRKRRIRHVREFERMLAEEGTTMLKVFLHLSKDEQRKRLEARLADPAKRWKFRLDDLENRAAGTTTCAATTPRSRPPRRVAPWYVVPADHKWASGLAVAELLATTLEAMNPQVPAPVIDLEGVVIEE